MVLRPVFSFSLISLLGCAFLAPSPAAAWTPEGHQVMCAITESLLDEPTKRETERLLAVFGSAASDLPSACAWLDWIRSRGVGHFDRWHYLNQPINPGGLPVQTSHPDDAVFAIRRSIDTLRDDASTEFGRAFALRVLIHVVGDIHQPLHTVSRYSPAHPDGDRGGNDVPVVTGVEGDRDDTLHIFWDRGVGILDGLPRRSPAASGSASENEPERQDSGRVHRLAAELRRAVQLEESAELLAADPEAWAREGLTLATDFVYRDLEEGAEPSAEYVRRAEPVVRRQLVLGAHRLAALLDSLLTPHPP